MTDQAESHLVQAERHISEGEQRIAGQKALIEQLAVDGRDTTEASNLLVVLQDTLTLMLEHRQQILREMAGKSEDIAKVSHD